MKNIVIIGAGFGGVQAALNLEKRLNGQVKITLIDRRNYHLFTSNLFEVASSEEELTSLSQMEKSITLPLKEIFYRKHVDLVQDEVKEIFPQQKKIALLKRDLNYDYLILAHGSQSDFFNITGAQNFSLTLKSLADAFRIRNQVEFAVQQRMYDSVKKVIRIVVAGGGYTGLELAGELKGLLDILALKYRYPREKIELQVIEAMNKLVPGFDERLSNDAYRRLEDLGVKISISARISEVDKNFVFLMSGEKIAYDLLVWTTGIKAVALASTPPLTVDAKGRSVTNEFLQTQSFPEIFALGDAACILDEQKKPVPASAQDAWHQARYIGRILPEILNNRKPAEIYRPDKHGFIVSLGGKWAIMSYKGIYITGYLAWLIDQFSHLRYYWSVVGFWKAVKYIWFQMEVYSRND